MDKLHETTVKFQDTDIWMDSCGEEELNYGLERGISGATSNPTIICGVIAKELDLWEPRIRAMASEYPEATEDDLAWKLMYEISALRSQKLLPVFQENKGRKGRLSTQTNAKYYRDSKRLLNQALEIHGLARNMQVKIPASEAGIQAMEEATYHGVCINATVCFTVAQAIAVAEAVERGLSRRRAEGLPIGEMSPVCTLMMGRTDDWLRDWCEKNDVIIDPECLDWVGVAVMKETYRLYRERGYTTRLLMAACRNHHHWSQLLGGDLCMTINYGWQKKLNGCDVPVEAHINDPVPPQYMAQLDTLSEFRRSFEEKGMEPQEFVSYGGFRHTLKGFLESYDELVRIIRDIIV